MAKGIDPTMIGLLAAGGYGVYAYSKSLWPFNAAAPVTSAATPNYVPAKTPAPKPVTTPSTTPATPDTNAPAVGALSISNGATYQWNGSAWTLVKSAPVAQACPTGYTRVNALDPLSACVAPTVIGQFCSSPGWSIDANGNCVEASGSVTSGDPLIPDTSSISQKMIAAAGMSSGLSTDEWCYYYSQVTGNDCPVDPESIAYDSGDRSTPIDIGTWLGLMNQSGAGLSGLGDLSTIPSWGWLAAAGLVFMLMGGK